MQTNRPVAVRPFVMVQTTVWPSKRSTKSRLLIVDSISWLPSPPLLLLLLVVVVVVVIAWFVLFLAAGFRSLLLIVEFYGREVCSSS